MAIGPQRQCFARADVIECRTKAADFQQKAIIFPVTEERKDAAHCLFGELTHNNVCDQTQTPAGLDNNARNTLPTEFYRRRRWWRCRVYRLRLVSLLLLQIMAEKRMTIDMN